MKVLISLFDYTGNASKPYMEAGWEVVQIDIQHGCDIMNWNYKQVSNSGKVIVIAMIPCDNYATSGAKHFKKKDDYGITEKSQKVVERVKKIIDYFDPFAWQVENPRTRIHKLNPWLGQRPKFIFNPCDFAEYDPVQGNSLYNKETWLFGKFNDPVIKRLEPIEKDNPGWRKYGGKSLKTKNARSITPLGFAYAFYEANH